MTIDAKIMPTYKLNFIGYAEVEAENEEEARDLANNMIDEIAVNLEIEITEKKD